MNLKVSEINFQFVLKAFPIGPSHSLGNQHFVGAILINRCVSLAQTSICSLPVSPLPPNIHTLSAYRGRLEDKIKVADAKRAFNHREGTN